MSTSLPSATNSIVAPRHDEIAQRARELWAEAGQPEGRDDEFWLNAEHRMLLVREEPDVSAVILATLAQPVAHPNIEKHTTTAKVRRGR